MSIGFLSLFFLINFVFYNQLPCRFLVVPSRPSACIIAAIVFVLSDHSDVSLVNTFFLFSIFLYVLHFVSLVCCIFSMPLPLKEKKKKKTVLYCSPGCSLCVDCFGLVAW